MRRFVEALLGPTLEVLMDRLEQSITIDKHIKLVNRLLYDTGKLKAQANNDSSAITTVLRSAISGVARYCAPLLLPQPAEIGTWDQNLSLSNIIDVTRLRDIQERGQFETSPEIQSIQLICLMDGEGIGKSGQLWPGSELKELSRNASWKGSGRQIARSRVLFTFIFCGLKSETIRVEDATDILTPIIENLPPKDWYPSAGTLYGTSYVLRSFLALRNCPRVFTDYARDVSERLLRHIEVRRRHALLFREDSVSADASYLLERIRFTLSILDAADLFCDARYLNVALKANDWHYRSVQRMKVPSNLTPENAVDLMTILHYIVSIANQERLWGKFFNDGENSPYPWKK